MGKQRPRVTRHVTYTPKKTVEYEKLVREIFKEKYKNHELINGPVKMHVTAYFKIPKSASKIKKTAMERNRIRPTKKPDWDNIGKIITDALNKVAYEDDKQVVSCVVEKYYSKEPRLQVEIESIN